jgi:hypothetical protein
VVDTIDEYRELAMLAHAWEEGALPGRLGFIGPIVEIPDRLVSQGAILLQQDEVRRLTDLRPLAVGSASQLEK